MFAAEPAEVEDAAFRRAREAKEISLVAVGKKFVSKLGRGLDGRFHCDNWNVSVQWERAGRQAP